MRILYVSSEYPLEDGTGGIGSYVAAVGAALAERGHDVHVLSCIWRQGARDVSDGRVTVHLRGLGGAARVGRFLPPRVAARALTAAAVAQEARRLPPPDVIEVPDFQAEGLALTVRPIGPVVAHLHTPLSVLRRYGALPAQSGDGSADRMERVAVRRCAGVSSPSQLLVAELRSTGWLGSTDVDIIRNPIELASWGISRPAEQTRPLMLYVGKLDERKAPQMLLTAAQALVAERIDVEVAYVGRSGGQYQGMPYDAWLLDAARQLGIPCQVIPESRREDLRAWYEAARVVVVPSRFDNFPMVALEGMAAGRPVVVSSRTGTVELFGRESARVSFPVGDARGLVAALRPLLTDPSSAGIAGRRARATVEVTCSPAAVARSKELQYEKAICREGA